MKNYRLELEGVGMQISTYFFLSIIIFFIIINIKLIFKIKYLKDIIFHKNNDIKQLNEEIEIKLNKARNIHQKMLPQKLPEPEDINISAYYKPAEIVGGDYYNIFPVDHGAMSTFFDQFLFYYFDVSGHGIDSALLSIFINEAIENYFDLQHNPGEMVSPGDLLNYINSQYQREEFPRDYLICLFLGVMDLNNYTITYTSAGFQIPVFQFNSTGEIIKFNTGGLPLSTSLGEFTETREEKTIKMAKDTSFLFSTDGLMEQKQGDKLYQDRLHTVIKQYSKLPPAFLKEVIINDFTEFTGNELGNDDITFLIFSRFKGEVNNWILKESGSERNHKFNEIKNYIKQVLTESLSSDKVVQILEEILLKNDILKKNKIKVKLFSNSEMIMLRLETDDSKFDWQKADQISGLSIIENNQKLEKDSLYISYNNFKNRVYFLLFI